MNTIKPVVLLMLFMNLCNSGKTQFLELFDRADTIETYGSILAATSCNDHFYYGSSERWEVTYDIAIRKVNKEGEIVWSASYVNYFGDQEAPKVHHIFVSQAGYVYAFIKAADVSFILKIEDSTGKIIGDFEFDDLDRFSFPRGIQEVGTDTLVFGYTKRIAFGFIQRAITLFDTEAMDTISVQFLPGSVWEDDHFDLVVGENQEIYYSKRDTIFKASFESPHLPIWKLPIEVERETVEGLTNLHFDEFQNQLFAFGHTDRDNALVIKIDPESGDLDWLYNRKRDDLRFLDATFSNNAIYVSWQHAFVGGGWYYVALDKIDKASGEALWTKDNRFVSGNTIEQAAHDIKLDSGTLFLTGYYSAANYDYGDWGFMTVDTATGDPLIRTSITSVSNGSEARFNAGLQVLPLPDKILCIGNNDQWDELGREAIVELDRDSGNIVRQIPLGGAYRFPAKTVDFAAFSSGYTLALKQYGLEVKLEVLDENGFTLDSSIISSQDFGMLPFLVKKVSEDLFVVATSHHRTGRSYFDLESGESRLILVDRALDIYSQVTWNHRDKKEQIIDVTFDSVNNRLLAVSTIENGDYIYHLIDVKPDESNLIFEKRYRFFGLDFPGVKNNLLMEYDSANYISFVGEALALDKNNLQISGTVIQPQVRTISRNAGIYNDSLLIFCGKTRQGENAVVSGLRRDTLVYEWEKELDVRGTALKWVQGEKEEIIYLLVQDQDFTIKLLKFDVQQQDLVWEKIVNRQATQTILASGIAFNPQDQSISIIGNYSYNEGRHDGNFIKFFDTEGNVFFEKIDEGNYKGKTQAIAIFSFPNAPVTLIGGSRTQHSIQHDAFLSFYNVNFVSESTPLNIFYDNNENGIKDENDNNISIGNFTIDESLTAYPNFNGIYLIPPDSNSELVEYNLPVNWKLTTDSLQYHLTSNNTSMGVDTLFFGIAPLVKVNETETFIISDPTICNEVSEVRLFVKNTGTETVNILASFETRDSILSYSILTDSIVNNKSYWTFNEVGPNEFRIIDMSLQIAGVEAIGEDVVFQSTATSSTSDDEEKQISSFIYREVLLCAYDPNDKLVQPKGMGKDNRTPFGETFNYTIRFQNTGNFPARNIILKDTLDGHLNLKTFEVIHASHDITSIVIENRVLTFTFNDINLPDSTNNEPLSHGYVNFKITPLDGLGENTLIENSAAIYFDQNPAIITNTTKNTLASDITTSTEEQKEQYQLILYPNPTTGILNIEADPPLSYPSHWKVYNQLGQVVKEGKALSNQIDLSDLQNGWYVFQIAGEITRKVMILR